MSSTCILGWSFLSVNSLFSSCLAISRCYLAAISCRHEPAWSSYPVLLPCPLGYSSLLNQLVQIACHPLPMCTKTGCKPLCLFLLWTNVHASVDLCFSERWASQPAKASDASLDLFPSLLLSSPTCYSINSNHITISLIYMLTPPVIHSSFFQNF